MGKIKMLMEVADKFMDSRFVKTSHYLPVIIEYPEIFVIGVICCAISILIKIGVMSRIITKILPNIKNLFYLLLDAIKRLLWFLLIVVFWIML